MCRLSLVLPAYNESEIITATVDELDTYMRENMPDWTYEILIVDDGSTDGMQEAIKRLLARGHVRTIRHEANRGRGGALRSGFAASRGEYIVTLDSDLSYSPDHISKLVEPLTAGRADITLASAYHPQGSVKNVPLIRAMLSRYGNKVLSVGMHNKYFTSTCIVRGYRAAAIRRLELINNGKDIHLEILQKANLFDLRVEEVPARLEWRDARRAKRVGAGRRFPLLAMSGAIASHLIYNYVLRPGSLLVFPILLLSFISLSGAVLLLVNWISHFINAEGASFFATLYTSLRETLLQGGLTLAITVSSAIVSLIFFAFYFSSHQSKQQFEELYVLLARANARLKELEERQRD